MNFTEIKRLQKIHGFTEIQNMINSGICWLMEGSTGRAAMECLRSGACYLPNKQFRDYYGNKIPARSELKEGTTGTILNSVNFWENF